MIHLAAFSDICSKNWKEGNFAFSGVTSWAPAMLEKGLPES